MADWFRVPLWCHGRDRREEAAVAVYVLGEWHIGRAPSPLEIKTEFGWGWTRAAKFLETLWAWAGEANAMRPPTARAGAKPSKIASGEESGSDRGAIGERSGSDDVVAMPIVDAERGASGERSGSERGASRARLSSETDVDGRRSGAPTCSSDSAPTPAAATLAPLTLSDAWAKHLPTDTTTTDTPAPVKARPVKRTPRTTPDTHAREVIGGWCDAYREATGATYAITSADAGKLRRAAADYATGEAWVDGVERLTRGMATYIRDPKRFPPGPPTVTGFLIDPQRWIAIAESAAPAANGPPVAPAPIDTNPFRRTKP